MREREERANIDMQPLTKSKLLKQRPGIFVLLCTRIDLSVSVTNADIHPHHEESTCAVRTNCGAPLDCANDCGSSTCSHTARIDDDIGLVCGSGLTDPGTGISHRSAVHG